MFSQYGEEKIIHNFFGPKRNGFLIDIGACDGETFSNSRDLIKTMSWGGILIEPHPSFFEQLKQLYDDNPNIEIKNLACFDKNTTVEFYIFANGIDSCGSTISLDFKQKMINLYGDQFQNTPIEVETITLSDIQSNCSNVDFLSIDCEGVDMNVLRSNDWIRYRPSLICIEHSMDYNELHEFMKSVNYVYYDKTVGNTFFVDKLNSHRE